MTRRLTLVAWEPAEATARAEELARAGFVVGVFTDRKGNPRVLRDDPPDVFLIDLSRSPAQGREVGAWLRRQTRTRRVPLVFVEGNPEKTDRVRALLPDASYTRWEDAATAIREAVEAPPDDPVVPGTMDAYTGAPLVTKLGIRDENVVGLVNPPNGFEAQLDGLPQSVRVVHDPSAGANLLLLFVRSRSELAERFSRAAETMTGGGRLWICWPKKASGVVSDLSQAAVRAFGLERKFVDYKISAIDATWSGLCFARRRREG